MKVLTENNFKGTVIIKSDDEYKHNACEWLKQCPCEFMDIDGCEDSGCPAGNTLKELTHAEAVEFWKNAEVKK